MANLNNFSWLLAIGGILIYLSTDKKEYKAKLGLGLDDFLY